jgi:hypothetical protein
MSEVTFDAFINLTKSAKGRNRLHGLVEERLASLLTRMYPDALAVPEVSGVLGGRNDLIQFFFNGRRVVFELFFSPSQVPQDLRLLEQSQADVMIAILLDKQVDPRLATEFFRKKPNAFPFLWLSRVMLPANELYCCARLRELIDENAAIVRLRRILSHPVGVNFERAFTEQLASMERALELDKPDTDTRSKLTGGQVLSLLIVGHIKKLRLPFERLRPLYLWLQANIEVAFRLVAAGFQTFFITDLNEMHAIWTDGDLADNLIIGAAEDDSAQVVICVNRIINEFMEKKGHKSAPVCWHFFHNYAESPVIIIPPPAMFQKPEIKGRKRA